MFSTEYLARVATAAVGALVLSTLSVVAAVGPAQSAGPQPAVYASVHNGTQAHG
jgi:hypothetical protein